MSKAPRKVGRNDPCPCGSGKKYKKCHGMNGKGRVNSRAAHQAKPGSIPVSATSMQIAPMGLPGQHQHLVVVSQFRDPGDPRNNSSPQGMPGKYTVTFVLARPGFTLLPEGQHSFANGLRGNSHLGIAPPVFTGAGDVTQIRMLGTTEDGTFVFDGFPNERGFLGKIVSEPFDASSFHDAEAKAHRALASSLSNLSVHLDIPLSIVQTESLEVRTQNTQTSILTPYSEVPMAIRATANLLPEFRGYASLYREALNSNSSVYQFLCLFKMIEAMQKRRARLATAARKAGQPFTRKYENIPANPDANAITWLNAIFSIRPNWDPMALASLFPDEVRGKSFQYVIDKVLYPMRVDVAHAISSQSGELTLSIDELLHTRNLNKWLPLTKCIVRRMLKNDFPSDFLAYLQEDGTITP
jgi:SEC-C motif